MASGNKTSHRGLKLCCLVTAVLLVIIAVVIITLAFTIFKPKDPKITLHPDGLLQIINNFSMFTNVSANVTFSSVITIENRNYGSFKFKTATAYVNYQGDVIGEAPIDGRQVPARDELNMTTFVSLMPLKLLNNPHFAEDFGAGSFNLTSTVTSPGKVSVLKIFKLHATVHNMCKISVFFLSRSVESICETKLKL